jgi:enoyl-CoA hydratase/3-hydroxyacyl-CoA dehydrogenase
MNMQCTDLSDMQQIPGATDLGLMPRKITKVAILGGGLMGSGIATTLILSNYPVILKEVNEKFLNAGIDRIKGNCFIICLHFGESFDTLDRLTILFSPANLQSRVRKGKMTKERYEKAMSLVIGVLDYDSFRNVDLVIEARFVLIHAPMIIVF